MVFSFPWVYTGSYTIAFPGSQVFRLGRELHHQLSLVTILLADHRNLNLHNQVSQFLIIAVCLSVCLLLSVIYTYPTSSVSPKNSE